MSKLAEFRALEQQLAAQMKELEALKNNGALKREIEFEQKLRSLLSEYNFSLRDVISLLDPQSLRHLPSTSSSNKKTRKPREVKTYRNPHTSEIVQTKGGNNRTLNDLKAQYGAEAVASWVE